MLTEIIGARKAVHTVADEHATPLDVSAWLDQKVAAIVAPPHRGPARGAARPGRRPPREARRRLLATEWYVETPTAADAGAAGVSERQLAGSASRSSLSTIR